MRPPLRHVFDHLLFHSRPPSQPHRIARDILPHRRARLHKLPSVSSTAALLGVLNAEGGRALDEGTVLEAFDLLEFAITGFARAFGSTWGWSRRLIRARNRSPQPTLATAVAIDDAPLDRLADVACTHLSFAF